MNTNDQKAFWYALFLAIVKPSYSADEALRAMGVFKEGKNDVVPFLDKII